MLKTREEINKMSKTEAKEYFKTISNSDEFELSHENFELVLESGIEAQELISWLKANLTDADAMRLGIISDASEMIGPENVTQEVIDRITKVTVIAANLWKDADYERFIYMPTDEMQSYMHGITDEAIRMANLV